MLDGTIFNYKWIIFTIQWGSIIRTCTDFEWSKKLVCKWSVVFKMRSEIWKPDILKLGQAAAIFSKIVEIPTKMSEFPMVQLQKVGIIAITMARRFEDQTTWNLIFKKSKFRVFPDFDEIYFRSPLWLTNTPFILSILFHFFLSLSYDVFWNNKMTHYDLLFNSFTVDALTHNVPLEEKSIKILLLRISEMKFTITGI